MTEVPQTRIAQVDRRSIIDMSEIMAPLVQQVTRGIAGQFAGFDLKLPQTFASATSTGVANDSIAAYMSSVIDLPSLTAGVLPDFDLSDLMGDLFDPEFQKFSEAIGAALVKQWAGKALDFDVSSVIGSVSDEGLARAALTAARYLPEEQRNAIPFVPAAARLTLDQMQRVREAPRMVVLEESAEPRRTGPNQEQLRIARAGLVAAVISAVAAVASAGVMLLESPTDAEQNIEQNVVVNLQIDIADAVRRDIESGRLDVDVLLSRPPTR